MATQAFAQFSTAAIQEILDGKIASRSVWFESQYRVSRERNIRATRNVEALHARTCIALVLRNRNARATLDYSETAEAGWRSVIRMSFQFGAQSEHRQSVERIATEPVQRKQNAETKRCAAAKPATARNLFHNRTGKRKRATPCLLEESICRLQDNSRMRVTGRAADDCDAVMDAQCDTQTIEARTKVRSASGNANSNFLHRKYSAYLASRGAPLSPRPLRARFRTTPARESTRHPLSLTLRPTARPRLQRIVATPARAANPSIAPRRFRSMPLERRKKMNFGWIDPSLLRDFQAEGTDAHRLCTSQDGWLERFGRDVLISFKSVLARERLLEDVQSWARSSGIQVRRVFARFISRKNEQREPPRLIIGDPQREFADHCHRMASEVRDRLRHRLLAGSLSGPERESPLRASFRTKAPAELFCLHLLFFRVRRMQRCKHVQHRSVQKVSRARTREFRAEQSFNCGPTVYSR